MRAWYHLQPATILEENLEPHNSRKFRADSVITVSEDCITNFANCGFKGDAGKAQGLLGMPDPSSIDYSETVTLDLDTVEPSLAGPKRPQDRVLLKDMKKQFNHLFSEPMTANGFGKDSAQLKIRYPTGLDKIDIGHGDVLLAATEQGLAGVWFVQGQLHMPDSSQWTTDAAHPTLLAAAQQLHDYFSGQRQSFDLPLQHRHVD